MGGGYVHPVHGTEAFISDAAFGRLYTAGMAASFPTQGAAGPGLPHCARFRFQFMTGNAGARSLLHKSVVAATDNLILVRSTRTAFNASMDNGIPLFMPGLGGRTSGQRAIGAGVWLTCEQVVEVYDEWSIQIRVGTNAIGNAGAGVADVKMIVTMLEILQ